MNKVIKLKKLSNFWNNYIENESNGDRNKNLSLEEYLKMKIKQNQKTK